jgi:hypothetical protein
VAGWSPGQHAVKRPEPARPQSDRRLTLRVWRKRQVVVSLAVVDVRRASDTSRV